MSGTKLAALVLIAAGVLGLVYGSFRYTRETHTARMGPMELTVKDRDSVNIPIWLGIGAVVVGVVLLLPRKR